MTTTWKSGDKKPSNPAPNNNTISGTMLSSWSRQQKLRHDRSLRDSRAITRGECVLKARSKTGAGRGLQPCAEFGNACGRGNSRNHPNRRGLTRTHKEDAQETSCERHL